MKSRPKFSRGFTLIELLVVMTIIAVLASGIFAAAQAAIRKARGVQAQNMAVGLAGGINNFRSDYSRWPLPTGTSSSADYTTGESNQALLVNLMGGNTDKNKRGRNFLDTLPIAKNGVGGLVYQGTGSSQTADLYDPWGILFKVMIDADNDGEIKSPPPGARADTTTPLMIKVGVFSLGADKKDAGMNDDGQEGSKDNVRSW